MKRAIYRVLVKRTESKKPYSFVDLLSNLLNYWNKDRAAEVLLTIGNSPSFPASVPSMSPNPLIDFLDKYLQMG